MSYYNNYSDNSGNLNGDSGSYNRDPRLNSNAAHYQNSVADTAHAQSTGYNYDQYGGQVYQGPDQNYANQYSHSAPSTPTTPSPYVATDPNYPYYMPQTNQQSYYATSNQQHNQNYTQQQNCSNYDQPPNSDHSDQQGHHYVYDLSFPDEVELENDASARSDEELWVEAWLARLGKIQIRLDSTSIVVNNNSGTNKSATSKTLSKHRSAKLSSPRIGEARCNLRRSFKILASIESIHKHLNENLSTLSSDEWRQSTDQIGTLRDELSVLMTPFEGDSFACLHRLVKLRMKKRCMEKKKRATIKEARDKDKEERVRKHEEIDGWLERERAEVQRMQEEEAAKCEADIILADTTRKKLDAKRNLALVQALTKLRDVREKAALGRGEKMSAQDAYAFQNLAERLQEIWTNALKEYGKEEHRLRTQLEQTTSEDQRKAKIEREKKVTDDWSKAFFGEPLKEGEESGLYLGLTAAERNVDTFIAIRKSWDTFLAKSDDLLGSKIPIGWVLPKEHVSDKWPQYLILNT